ncbi:hypothetical protein V1514DRAFT_36320 [Lipomyces japonicus]|uniref:uncharacterized protein n=1 Tax=Lipomyces japonicus TaxID=56871 RepID=UPI0034D00DA6
MKPDLFTWGLLDRATTVPKLVKHCFARNFHLCVILPVYSRSADESEKRAQPVVAKDGSGPSAVCTHIDKIKSITAGKEAPDLSKFIYLGLVEDGYENPLSSEATFRRELSRFHYMPICSELVQTESEAMVCLCLCHSHNLKSLLTAGVKIKAGKPRSQKRSLEIKKQGLTKTVERVGEREVRFVHVGSIDEQYTSPDMIAAVVRRGVTKVSLL